MQWFWDQYITDPAERTLSSVSPGVVQVHRDAESMEFHMKTVAEKAARAYAETLEATTSIQVYGTPSEAVLQMLSRQAGAGVPLVVKRHHLGGFTRTPTD